MSTGPVSEKDLAKPLALAECQSTHCTVCIHIAEHYQQVQLRSRQCCGSMTFRCGSGSADPCFWLMDPWHLGVDPYSDSDPDADLDPDADPDPSIFIIDLQDANKKLILKSFSAYYFLKKLLIHFSKIKKSKRSHKTYLLFLLHDRRIRTRNTGSKYQNSKSAIYIHNESLHWTWKSRLFLQILNWMKTRRDIHNIQYDWTS